jgi:ribonucleoside-diphosphate reductase alpha chain
MSDELLPTDYQTFIHRSRYARWDNDLGRREDWLESVTRFMVNVVNPKVECRETRAEIYNAIKNCEVMPSMRMLMTAGAALDRDNTAGYNCSYLPVRSIEDFSEAMFILLCGCGVGFSVERQNVSQLPEVPSLEEMGTLIEVGDSKEGWAYSLRVLIEALYSGRIPTWDTSAVRPAGAKLKTFGGRASGPKPLEELFTFFVETFKKAQGRKLTSLECHDLMCKIGDVVVVGGVRRSAMISLSNLSDDRMRSAKSGQWWENNGHRALANNSAVYTEKPDSEIFMREFLSLIESKSGERGIFSRAAARQKAEGIGRDPDHEWGTNPCSEIILRPYQFCNLTEVVVRPEDDYDSLWRKVRIATILGTIQSTYTHFPFLRDIWKKNTEEERLLGVSLTGIFDNPLLSLENKGLEETIGKLRSGSVTTNSFWSKRLGIPKSAAITCVKPSGTVSQLVDSASGIHPRHSAYYIRTVRADNNDPLCRFLKDEGVPSEPCVMKPEKTTVFSFPMKAPKGAKVREEVTAIEHLELWLAYARHWCDHKPSITVSVKDHEWPAVASFVYENFDDMSGISFLPYSEHTYKQAPYQEISQKEYEELLGKMPESIDWKGLTDYEREDTTVGSQSYACSAGACEIVDLT